MSNPSRLLAVVALLVFGAAGGAYLNRPVVAQEKAAPVVTTKWEYRTVNSVDTPDAEKQLNKLGAEGFELVFQTNGHASSGGVPNTVPVVNYTLKRAAK